MQQEAIEVGMSTLHHHICEAMSNIRLAQEAMDKYTIEKVRKCASNGRKINSDTLPRKSPTTSSASYARPSQNPRSCLTTTTAVRRAQGRDMALHCWPQLRQLRHARYVTASCITVHGLHLTSSTETKHFIYFYLGHCAILLFKTQ